MFERIRALDTIENFSEWSVRNPIFAEHTSMFDDAFTLEKGLDPKYYCTHGNFESEMCDILFSSHEQRDAKIEILVGNIGTGKTTFSSYMGNYKLAIEYGKKLNKSKASVFYLHLNCYNRYTTKSTINDFEKSFSDEFMKAMIKNEDDTSLWKFNSLYDLINDMAKKDGYLKDLTYEECNASRTNLTSFKIMDYLTKKEDIDILFIVIDNMDEIPKLAQEEAFAFALKLSDHVQNSTKKISIMIPLRQYTDKAIDTERYYKKSMPHYATKDIMIMKLEHVKDIFNKSYQTLMHQSEPTIYRKYEDTRKEVYVPSISHRDIIIENIIYLFKIFITKVPDSNPHSMLSFIKSISSGNLKLVTKNTYNFFHSCKLNLTNMMTFAHTPVEDVNYKEIEKKMEKELYGEPIIYDLLMAIHYPFYDVDASNIVNVYNLSNSNVSNDFRNTLALPRLLMYLNNTNDVKFIDLKQIMSSIGYSGAFYNECIKKGLEYCLLDIQHGTLLEHLSEDTNIRLSDAGRYMVENIMTNHRYLSYVCEDTPMEKEFVIRIDEKYKKGDYRGNLEKMHLAVQKFYQFIKKEENKEIEHVKSSFGIDQNIFLKDFSINVNGEPIKLSEHIRDITLKVTKIHLQ